MQYHRYGITLQLMEEQHLDMVRQWRNSDLVRSRMHFRDTITEEAQAAWFAGLNRNDNFYFVGFIKEQPFGVFNIKNIRWTERTGEAGAFVAHARFVGSPEPAFAILALMDFAFLELKLALLEAKYNPAFKAIYALNQSLGYEVMEAEEGGFIRARVSAGRYLQVTGHLRKAAERLSSFPPSP